MDINNFITVQDSSNHYYDFVNLMQATTQELINDSKIRKAYYLSRNGDKLEDDVLLCMKSKAKDFRFNPDKIEHTSAQHFPDIISNNYYGVEVKSTKKNSWTSVGSSIQESLRSEDIKKVFMLFGILSQEKIDFRCKPYEDCLSDISITHSPRYLINMDLNCNDDTIFGKMNVDYDTFRQLGNEQMTKVREYYKVKYKDRDAKTMPWWYGDSNQDDEINEFSLLNDFETEKKNYFLSLIYSLFPEILGTDPDKFRRPVLWLCSRYSIVCSNFRDMFTAGGVGKIYIDDQLAYDNVPKVICNLLQHFESIKAFYHSGILMSDYENFSNFSKSAQPVFDEWIKAADIYIAQNMGENKLVLKDIIHAHFVRKRSANNAYFLETK